MKRPPEAPLLDPRVLRTVARAPHAYVAIETASGPHVTPLLFAITATRLWFVMARTTLKVKVLRKRPAVGLVIDGGASALVVRGEAAVLDPLRPRDLAAKLAEVARAPLGSASYGLHNPLELMTFARDAARVPGRAQPNLALVSVRPLAIEVVAGRKPAEPQPDEEPLASWSERLEGVPGIAARLVPVPGPAVLAWLTPQGPVAVPAQWDPASSTAADVAWPLLERAGAPSEGKACLCLDGSHGKGPIAKYGVLLRGTGRGGEDGRAAIAPDRVTWWDGFDTGTAAVAAAPA
jgi:hypothetical protein